VRPCGSAGRGRDPEAGRRECCALSRGSRRGGGGEVDETEKLVGGIGMRGAGTGFGGSAVRTRRIGVRGSSVATRVCGGTGRVLRRGRRGLIERAESATMGGLGVGMEGVRLVEGEGVYASKQ
jgi:hypothetical protein